MLQSPPSTPQQKQPQHPQQYSALLCCVQQVGACEGRGQQLATPPVQLGHTAVQSHDGLGRIAKNIFGLQEERLFYSLILEAIVRINQQSRSCLSKVK